MKNLVLLMMAFFALSLTGCKDDDNSIAESVSGKYVGGLEVTFVTPETYDNQNVYITATADDRMNLELRDFKFGEMNVGTIVVKDILVQEKQDTDEDTNKAYTYRLLTGKGTVRVNIEDQPMDLDFTLDGDEYQGTLYIELDVKFGEDVVEIVFEGVRK